MGTETTFIRMTMSTCLSILFRGYDRSILFSRAFFSTEEQYIIQQQCYVLVDSAAFVTIEVNPEPFISIRDVRASFLDKVATFGEYNLFKGLRGLIDYFQVEHWASLLVSLFSAWPSASSGP